MYKKILYIICSTIIGCVFLFSAYTKTLSIDIFEFRIADSGWVNWEMSPYVARIIISLEICIGILFLLNNKFKFKFIPIIGILVISIFNIYVLSELINNGSNGNCGCFGEIITMTPLESLIKNILSLILLIVLLLMSKSLYNSRTIKLSFISFVLITIFVFIANPLIISESSVSKKIGNKLSIEKLYAPKQQYKPKVNLKVGKKIIVFLSMKCPHCKLTAKKLSIIHKQQPNLPIYILLNGKYEHLDKFVKEHNITDIPHNLFLGSEDWISLAGIHLPVIYLVNNSIIEGEYDGDNFKVEEIINWFYSN